MKKELKEEEAVDLGADDEEEKVKEFGVQGEAGD